MTNRPRGAPSAAKKAEEARQVKFEIGSEFDFIKYYMREIVMSAGLCPPCHRGPFPAVQHSEDHTQHSRALQPEDRYDRTENTMTNKKNLGIMPL